MVEAAFAAASVDAEYVSITVEPADLADALGGIRALGFSGLHITVPHKVAVVPLVDELTPAAELAGAVNCVKREGRKLVGDNTDGKGFLARLRGCSTRLGSRLLLLVRGALRVRSSPSWRWRGRLGSRSPIARRSGQQRWLGRSRRRPARLLGRLPSRT
jgi:hypothetical protein